MSEHWQSKKLLVPLASVLSSQSVGLLFYLLVQYILVTRLTPPAYGAFIACNTLALLVGQLSTAGLDGKILSNLPLSTSTLKTGIAITQILEYLPFSILTILGYLFILNLHDSPLSYLKNTPLASIYILINSVVQPLLSITMSLADRGKNIYLSNSILIGPWCLRVALLLIVPIAFSRFSLGLTYEYTLISYTLSVALIFCIFLSFLVYNGFSLFLSFSSKTLAFTLAHLGKSVWRNKSYFLMNLLVMSPVALAPTFLINSSKDLSLVPSFSFAYVLLGIFQSVGSQYLIRQHSARILYLSSILPLRKLFFHVCSAARDSLYFYLPCFVFVLLLYAAQIFRVIPAYKTPTLSLTLVMMAGLYPSAVVTLLHQIINKLSLMRCHLLARLIAFVLIIFLMFIASSTSGAYGLSMVLAIYPVIVLASYAIAFSPFLWKPDCAILL